MSGSVLVLASSDYRSDEDANVWSLAKALSETSDEVRIISVAFDPSEQSSRAQRIARRRASGVWENVDGVKVFLWSMPWAPISASGVARWLIAPAYELWAEWPCRELDAAAARAATIVVQSGPSAALIGRLRRRAPHAKIIYYADDPAVSAAMHPRVHALLQRNAGLFDHAVVAARAMLPNCEAFGEKVSFVPCGVELDALQHPRPTPFKARRNVVTLGSPWFDASVIQIAANALPDTHFHLIGTPTGHRYPANVSEYGTDIEIAAYLQHASLGAAPYVETGHSDALVDTSAALLRFGHLGVPAVCPWFAVGDRPFRVGYEPGRSASVREAFARAFRLQRGSCRVPALRWSEVAKATTEGPHPVRDGERTGWRHRPSEVAYAR